MLKKPPLLLTEVPTLAASTAAATVPAIIG
jgi:hypothetical protein